MVDSVEPVSGRKMSSIGKVWKGECESGEEEYEVPGGLRGKPWVWGNCEHSMALSDTGLRISLARLQPFYILRVYHRRHVGCNCCQIEYCFTTIPSFYWKHLDLGYYILTVHLCQTLKTLRVLNGTAGSPCHLHFRGQLIWFAPSHN